MFLQEKSLNFMLANLSTFTVPVDQQATKCDMILFYNHCMNDWYFPKYVYRFYFHIFRYTHSSHAGVLCAKHVKKLGIFFLIQKQKY